MKHSNVFLSLALALASAGWTVPARGATQADATSASAPAVVAGAQCAECHDAEAKAHVFHRDCATCHAGAVEHSQAERPKKFKVGKPGTAECLACHSKDDQRVNFVFAEHNRAGVACADCHGIHAPKVVPKGLAMEQAGATTALCATCHQDVLVRFSMPSHHPVPEGGVTCVGCHDPHSGEHTLLTSRTERCTTCHQNLRGPHVFEHPAAAEDCSNCHDPHGSPVRNLLTVGQPVLCLQCHSIASNRHGRSGAASNAQVVSGAVLRDCVACHGAIHGSSTDQHLRH